MTQGLLPFQYEEDKSQGGMTSLSGLPLYLDLAHLMGLRESIDRHVDVRKDSQGYSDAQVVTSLILLNLAGGDCVDDLKIVENDEGFSRVLRSSEYYGMKRKERRLMERRFRKKRSRSVPSCSSVFRYLSHFHDEEQEDMKAPGKAFIGEPNAYLRGLSRVNTDCMGFFQRHRVEKMATLDMDALVIETHKRDAFHSYKGYKSYQPLNTWWHEQGVVLHTEFRDGNVPSGFEQLRVLQEALECLPEGVEQVRVRSDTAGYQHDLLRWCEEGKSERFGRIEFAIGCDVTEEYKVAVSEVEEEQWSTLYIERDGQRVESERQWAEVCFVPNAIGKSKKGLEYRYLAIREPIRQRSFPWADSQESFPFPTLYMQDGRYKLFGIVTNMDWDAQELIAWHYKRCGKSEEAHSVMREDLAGSRFPSGGFGQNAAWWWIMILALNLNAAMKSLVLRGSWVCKRMKAIRFSLINLPGRVLERSRRLWVRLPRGHPSLEILVRARQRIMELLPAASG
jgi:hypothetical protein